MLNTLVYLSLFSSEVYFLVTVNVSLDFFVGSVT